MAFEPDQPSRKPSRAATSRPQSTFDHSEKLIPPMPFCSAIAAPVMPAISAWD